MCNIVYTNEPQGNPIKIVGDAKLEAVVLGGGQQLPIRLWSGQPGIISGNDRLEFVGSLSIEITYGTAVIATCGGPGNYDVIHDPSKRGPVARLVEDDGQAVTEIYVDLESKRATIGLGWVQDFQVYAKGQQ